MILLVDNYDSFTWNLVQRFGELDPSIELDRDLVVARNDRITPDEAAALDGRRGPSHVVISPGPCTPNEAGISAAIIERFAGRVPILGVCLGHQCMADMHGLSVERHAVLMHGKTSAVTHDGKGLFEGVPSPFVRRRVRDSPRSRRPRLGRSLHAEGRPLRSRRARRERRRRGPLRGLVDMSRIGKSPVVLPDGVKVETQGSQVQVTGPKGTLEERIPSSIGVELADGELRFARADERKETRAAHGLARALVSNMVTGVTTGFSRELEIQGVGYRAESGGKTLKLTLGFSHPVEMPVPEGLAVKVEENKIRVEGIDKQQVGQFAAEIRKLRPPEPYKGKGIRYVNEHVRRKVGKAGTA